MMRGGKLPCFFSLAAAAVILGIGSVAPGLAKSTKEMSVIKIAGAQSMYPRIHAFSVIFMKNHPGVKVEVTSGSTVDAGMTALIEGSADVAMASRKITEEEIQLAREKGVELVERLIGYGGIVVVVNASNRMNDLSLDELKRILSGEAIQWKEFGGSSDRITVVRTAKETHPGTLRFMEKEFLGKSVAKEALVVRTFPEVLQKVAEIPGAIGYVRIRDAFETPEPQSAPIKVLKIRENYGMAAVMPSRETVKDGTYPLKRSYFLYHDSRTSQEVRMLVDYLVSKGWGTLSDAALRQEK